jgi:hypothetical protein
MGKLLRPILFSDKFNVPAAELAKRGLLDPILNADTKLFIDPLLLRESKNSVIHKVGLKLLRERFANIIKLVMASHNKTDPAWKAARRLLNLAERRETCLGFGGSSVSGSSRPDTVKDRILETTHAIVDLGIDNPEIISLMGFLEDGIGPDSISDLATNAIMPALAQITSDVCSAHQIPQEQFAIEGSMMALPQNPLGRGRHGVVLVPRDILRELPIATDWNDISRVAFENQQIRDQVNALIGNIAKATVAQKKRALRQAALESAKNFRSLFEGLLEAADKSYDPVHDRAGIYAFRRALQEIAAKYPHHIARPAASTRSELVRIVGQIISQFRVLVEKNDLADLLWDGNTPRYEKAAQLLFFAVAEAYCRANDIDISPETDSGGGPVDFKFSTGYTGRYLVELKLSTGRVVHGYQTQLNVYRDASGQCEASYLVVNVGKMGRKLATIREIRRKLVEKGESAPSIEGVDARLKPSASKR